MKTRKKRDGTSLTGFRVLLLFVGVYNGYMYAQQNMTAVKLKITDVSSGFSDETVVYFQPSASEAYDGSMDALKLISPNQEVPSLFSLSADNLPLSINALPDSLHKSLLPIYSHNNREGPYEFHLMVPDNGRQPASIYVIDELRKCYLNGFADFPMIVTLPSNDASHPIFRLLINRQTDQKPSPPHCNEVARTAAASND